MLKLRQYETYISYWYKIKSYESSVTYVSDEFFLLYVRICLIYYDHYSFLVLTEIYLYKTI